ncbi:uncharacterized protein METZ01_LOCUS508377, partial [marine metagenome]
MSRTIDGLDEVKKSIIAHGGTSESQAGDVSNNDSFAKVINNKINKWEQVDILINNAGITQDNIIIRMKEEEWDNVIDINLKGCFNGIKT